MHASQRAYIVLYIYDTSPYYLVTARTILPCSREYESSKY